MSPRFGGPLWARCHVSTAAGTTHGALTTGNRNRCRYQDHPRRRRSRVEGRSVMEAIYDRKGHLVGWYELDIVYSVAGCRRE